jgi:uncharacterized protein (DUF2062 family)
MHALRQSVISSYGVPVLSVAVVCAVMLSALVPETAEIPRLIVYSVAAAFVGSLSAKQRSATEALRESEQRFRDYIALPGMP